MLTSQGQSVPDAVRSIGVSEVTYYRWRHLLNGEIFYSLEEAQAVIEKWRVQLQHPTTTLGPRLQAACLHRSDDQLG